MYISAYLVNLILLRVSKHTIGIFQISMLSIVTYKLKFKVNVRIRSLHVLIGLALVYVGQTMVT